MKNPSVFTYNQIMKKYSRFRILGLCVTVSFVAGVIGGVLTNEYFIAYVFERFIQEQKDQMPIVKKVIEHHSYVEESKTIDAIKKVEPSVVSIVASNVDADKIINDNIDRSETFSHFTSDNFYLNSESDVKNYFSGNIEGGTGFFISSDGLVATCSSLVFEQANWFLITDNDELYRATVVYNDPYDDFALLKVINNDSSGYFPTIKFAEQDLENGQKALVIGRDIFKNNRVLLGIISHIGLDAINDEIAPSMRIFPNEFVIIDTNIDSNTNCGPAVNLGGELIGMVLNFDSAKTGSSYVVPVEALKEKFYHYQEMGE